MIKKDERVAFCTVCINPGVDRRLYLEAPFARGGMNRAGRTEICPGSKAANVARLLSRLGAEQVYVSATGGEFGGRYESFLKKEGIPCRFVTTRAGVRVNTKIMEPDGQVSEFNEKGGPLTDAEYEALLREVLDVKADCFVFSGSLPKDAPPEFYARLIRGVKETNPGAYTVLDCAGEPLSAGLAAGADCIKPNREELAQLFPEDARNALPEELCRRLRKTYPKAAILCTLGGDGALYFGGEGTFAVTQPKVEKPLCTVGAGDGFLACFLREKARGKDVKEALCRAAATASVQIMLPAGETPGEKAVNEAEKAVGVTPVTAG